jgi:hypothetical protein
MSKHGLGCARLVLLMGLAACDKSASHAVAASSFPSACEQSGDCAAIFEGELTCCGATSGCPNAAIRQDIVDAYNLEVTRRAPMCGADTKCTPPGSCAGLFLTCPHGRCELGRWAVEADGAAAPGPAISAGDYARTCASVADCKPIYEGRLGCCGLPCPNTAIRQDAFAQYEMDVGARFPLCIPAPGCTPPLPCASGRVACTNGTCELLFAP